jgi:hypothetical protein
MYRKLLGAVIVLGSSVLQLAASPVSVTVTGATGETDSAGYLISPYYATINGVDSMIYCDDFANQISMGQTWSANETNLASGNLSETRYGDITQTLTTQAGTASYDGQQLYEMAAWLTTQYGSNATTNGAIQDTIWDLFNPNAGDPTVHPPQPSSNTWLFAAETNYTSIDAADFTVITNTAPVTLSGPGQVQEFLITPEPSTTLLLGFGLMAVAIAGRRVRDRFRRPQSGN